MNELILLSVIAFAFSCCIAFAAPQGESDGDAAVTFPDQLPLKHPFLAATPDELDRLRSALKQGGPAAAPITQLIQNAEKNLGSPLDFPPRGGQHNQWYQCDACQMALRTVDATHHQCPKCNKVYSGEPYDDVLFSKAHSANLRRALDAAWAYAITARPEFAADARAVLLGYAERYSQFPYHDAQRKSGPAGGRLNEQTLGEASLLAICIAPAIDLLHDEAGLSPDDRHRINTGLLQPMMQNIAKHNAGKSNWQSWHNAALFAAAALLGDAKTMRETIDAPAHGFLFQMKISVSDEGMWYENSWSYHSYTLMALTLHAEYARRTGIDLWQLAPLQKMFTLPMRYEMPDGSLPRFGDAVGPSKGVTPNDLEAAYHAFKSPALLPALPTTPSLLSTLYGRSVVAPEKSGPRASEVFPKAGHALLRSNGSAGLAAAITFGPYGGFHGHFDKLSFVLFGLGRELAVDPGRAASQAYRLPIHTYWYKATVSHNTVVVNGKSQAPAEAKLLAFTSDPLRATAVTQSTQAYPGVDHRRLLYVGPDYALVVDDLNADQPCTFDWLYHNRGQSIELPPEKTAAPATQSAAQPAPLKDLEGQEYIHWTSEQTTRRATQTIIHDGDCHTVLTAAASDDETLLRAGDGVGASVDDRVPLLLLRRHGSRALFAVAIQPTRKLPGSVTAVEATTNGNSILVKVHLADAIDEFTLAPDGTCTRVTHTAGPEPRDRN